MTYAVNEQESETRYYELIDIGTYGLGVKAGQCLVRKPQANRSRAVLCCVVLCVLWGLMVALHSLRICKQMGGSVCTARTPRSQSH